MNAQERARLRQSFRTRYGRDCRLFQAPGRVNLIGEHTDYNQGLVLPVAIDRQMFVAGAPRRDRRLRVHTSDKEQTFELDLDAPYAGRRADWTDYVEGIARVLDQPYRKLVGADLLVASDLPSGVGLSSSAALSVALGAALLSLADAKLERLELARAAQQSENQFAGTQCGLMDPLISALAERDHALLFDCRSSELTQLPLDRARVSIVIFGSGVRHELSSSAYNERRAECERGAALLGVSSLRQLNRKELDGGAHQLSETVIKRCRHVVTEIERTRQAAQSLAVGDFDTVGRLMTASHASLRDDYEVSCRELDLLVEITTGLPGVFGSKVTGGGFGGCTVSLVSPTAVGDVCAAVSRRFHDQLGAVPLVLVSDACGSAGELLSDSA